jgi:Zn-dependent oligopeptidase
MKQYSQNPLVKKEISKQQAKSTVETSVQEKVLLDKARTLFMTNLRSDVMPLVENLLALKHQKAALHGLKSYSELKLARSMARIPVNVDKFYD